MTAPIPLLGCYAPAQAFAWYRDRIVSQGDIVTQAIRLADQIDGESWVLNLCDDRTHFIIAYAAALIARATSLLPPNRAPSAIRELYEHYARPLCLVDHADVPQGLRTRHVALDDQGSATCRDVPRIPAAQAAAVLFTSGSTGMPTPTTKTWGALAAGAKTLAAEFGIEPESDVAVVGTVPPQHMFGLESTVMLPLHAGLLVNTNRPLLPADVAATLAAIPGEKWLMTTPLHLHACVETGIALPSLRGVISSTMPLRPPLARAAEALCDVPLNEIYGCSEAGMVATRRTTRDTEWRLVQGIRAWQEDDITWIQGGHVEDPVRLADHIELRGKDQFILLGRIADMIKIAGKRTSLPALDAELMAVDGVVDGAFFLPDNNDSPAGGRLITFVVAPDLGTPELLAALRLRIDPVFLPRSLYRVEALPRNSNGKLPRDALRLLLERLNVHPARDTPP